MKMSRKTVKAVGKSVKASRTPAMRPRTKRVVAETEIDESATDLLFEVEDVAQLIAEVTGEDVAVEADGTAVTFDVAGDTFTCEADEETETVESSRKVVGRKPVSAGKTIPASRRKIAGRR